MKKRIYFLFCLLLLFFLFLGFSRFVNKEFAVRVWDNTKTVFTYNDSYYREEKDVPGTYFHKSVIENKKIYVSDSNNIWDKFFAEDCLLYADDPNNYFVFGQVHTFSACTYVREDFTYPTPSENSIKMIFINEDLGYPLNSSIYETTNIDEINEIVLWISKCNDGDILPDYIENVCGLSDRCYLYADYDKLPLVQALGYFDMDEMGNLRFFKLENVC